VVAAVGVDLVRAEAMPLFMAREALAPYRSLLTGILSEDEMVTFVAPVLPEPPEFEAALERARVLATNSEPDRAWAVVMAALPGWYPDSPHRIALVAGCCRSSTGRRPAPGRVPGLGSGRGNGYILIGFVPRDLRKHTGSGSPAMNTHGSRGDAFRQQVRVGVHRDRDARAAAVTGADCA
jgi:hypothetical protein